MTEITAPTEDQLSHIVNVVARKYQLAVNSASRNYRHQQDFGQINTKFNKFYCEIGIPNTVTTHLLRHYYERNGLAYAAVNAICNKTWENYPYIVEGQEENKNKEETPVEKEIKAFARRTRLWPAMFECDRRRAATVYGALLINIADAEKGEGPDTHWRREVGNLSSSDLILGYTPIWSNNITVSDYYPPDHPTKPNEPRLYSYNPYLDTSATTQNAAPVQSFTVHESRVLLLGEIDGRGNVITPGNKVILPGLNVLAMIEMIEGAMTAGTSKAASGHMKFIFDKEANLNDIAQSMGIPLAQLPSKMNEAVERLNNQIDSAFIGQGVDVSGIDISLPTGVTEFIQELKSEFAASTRVPVTEFRGQETGERSSTENARGFALTITSRQNNVNIPEIEELFKRFQGWGLFGDDLLVAVFPSLLEPTPEERLNNANTVADIAAKLMGMADTQPVIEKLYEMLEIEAAPMSRIEQEIDEMGEQNDREINDLPD